MLFLLACVWTAVSLAGGRLADLAVPSVPGLAREAVTAGMLLSGFLLLARSGIADLRPSSSVGFVRRPTAKDEFGRGVALGWAVAVASVLPSLLTGQLHLQFVFTAQAWRGLVAGMLELALFAVAVQLLLAGLPVRLLTRLASPAVALLAAMMLALLLALHAGPMPLTTILLLLIAVGMSVTGFLRTRGLWLSLGLQIGWTVVLQLVFGMGTAYTPDVAGIVQSTTTYAGQSVDSAYFVVLVAMAAWVAILPLTRTYAWHYTYQAPVAGGYPMDVAPPPQHAAQAAAQPAAPLIQISSALPQLPPREQ